MIGFGSKIGDRGGDGPRQIDAERNGDQRDNSEQLDKDHIDLGDLFLNLAATDADQQRPADEAQILDWHRHRQHQPALSVLTQLPGRLAGKRQQHFVIIIRRLLTPFAIDRQCAITANHAGSTAHQGLKIA